MTTAVIGATGRVGSEIVRGLLARGDAVTALVRDPDKARRAFGKPDGLYIRATRLDDPGDLTEAFDGIRRAFIDGIDRTRGRPATRRDECRCRNRLDRAGDPPIVLNASAASIGINQRGHYSIDEFASSTALPYSTIRPAICRFSPPRPRCALRGHGPALRAAAALALIDHRDAAEAGLRVLTDPALWGAHHELTGPVAMSWPEALELLSAELGEPVTFRVAVERQFLERLIGAGVTAGRLSCSSHASGRSSRARTTTQPTPSRRSPAAPHVR
jgi:uncharacterized protein YbjT (DUF2867 family)